jgi:hypothetical protein
MVEQFGFAMIPACFTRAWAFYQFPAHGARGAHNGNDVFIFFLQHFLRFPASYVLDLMH